MVGAHTGAKTEGVIRKAATTGAVLLIEPVPFLFKKLTSRYAAVPNVTLRNIAVSKIDGEIEFTAPTETANSIAPWGDQLGSMIASHATAHDPRMLQHIGIIRTQASSFETLIREENVSSIDILITDVEGMDAELLPTFPFSRILPKQIFFEFKHSDGFFRVGRKLANLLNILDSLNYHISVVDSENMFATLHPT
jgi:FkbM family methyltransferase